MAVTYEIGNTLYLNITNQCTNRCSFCVRNQLPGLGDGDSLWLTREPTVDEVVAEVEARGVSRYDQIVFCGFGEPMCRAYDVLEICRRIKAKYDVPIRINTNGHANLICGEDITPQLAGLVDSVSISLNAQDTQSYQKMCQPKYGGAAFNALLDFTAGCKKVFSDVTLTVVHVISEQEIEACREIARRMGTKFRVR